MNQIPEKIKFNDKVFSWRDGRHWFDVGVELFKQVKNQWYLACLMLGVLLALVANIQMQLVAVLVVFVSPIMTAFVMQACCQSKKDQVLSFGQLWQTILLSFNGLLALGVLSAVLSVVFHYIHLQLLAWFDLPVEVTEEMIKNMSGKESLLRAWLNLMTNLPIALALAFSPALVLFNQAPIITAVKHSVLGVVRSWKAFVVLMLLFLLVFFGVVLLASLIISIVTAVMGPSNQLLVNLIIMFFVITAAGIGLCAQYQAYREIFVTDNDSNEEDGSEIYAEI